LADPSGPRASFFQRLVAFLIDGILLGFITAVLETMLGRQVGWLFSLAFGIGYFGYLEGSASGQTIGKRVLNIRVVDLRSGGPIGFSRAVLRYFARILSTIPIFLGYFWMLWDAEKQTWHDKIARSVVVPVADFPVDHWPG
jgi:uncharacterized RDD family membrane protein YckC